MGDIARMDRIERDIADLRRQLAKAATVPVWMVKAMLEELFDAKLITHSIRAEMFLRLATELAEVHATEPASLDAIDHALHAASLGILPDARRRQFLENRRHRR